ncbi:hypothetical protein C0J52_09448 [Blattella germanica]|nr:hypothetical protein C0J52_09448 [Blattella germanica]
MIQVLENIQQLLERRRSPEERDGLLHFYDILLENISKEMDNCGCGKVLPNPHVQHLLDKLESDLAAAGEDPCICKLPPSEKRMEMLQILYRRTEDRKKEVVQREAALDRIERSLQGLEDDDDSEEDLTGDSLWLNAVEQGPSEHNMKRLLTVYPPELVER